MVIPFYGRNKVQELLGVDNRRRTNCTSSSTPRSEIFLLRLQLGSCFKKTAHVLQRQFWVIKYAILINNIYTNSILLQETIVKLIYRISTHPEIHSFAKPSKDDVTISKRINLYKILQAHLQLSACVTLYKELKIGNVFLCKVFFLSILATRNTHQ